MAVAHGNDLRHLTSEQIQEFLDQALTPKEEAGVQAHLSVCPRCREELETWGLLFSDLGAMPELDPGPDFSETVMRRLPGQKPISSKIRNWIRGSASPPVPEAHLPTEQIQDYVDGTLAGRDRARSQEHLAACESCQEEAGGWQRLFGALSSLGHLAPSPGFAEGIMARIRIPAPVPAPWAAAAARVAAWGRGFLPQSRKGWAVAGGIASAPTITGVALFYLVFSRPSLTLGSFATYVSWKAAALLEALWATAAEAAVESVTLFRAYAVLGTLAESPLLVGLGGLIFTLLSGLALWVLYRNLVTTQTPESRYVRARV